MRLRQTSSRSSFPLRLRRCAAAASIISNSLRLGESATATKAYALPAERVGWRITKPIKQDNNASRLSDHVGQADRPLFTLFDERLTFAAAADEAGIYCLHIAEHHATPLNMVPAPGAYLGAVARVTKRMRLGPLVYLLPLISPLRLVEEICMLDHLSHGRPEIGVGRGVSPFELGYHHIDHDRSREIFIDAYNCIRTGLTAETLNHSGPHFTYKDVPLPLRSLQQPHPAFWYGLLECDRLDVCRRGGDAFRQPRPNRLRQEEYRCVPRGPHQARRRGLHRRLSSAAALRSACCATSSLPIPMPRRDASPGLPSRIT